MWGALTTTKTKTNCFSGSLEQKTQSNNAHTAHLSSKLGIVSVCRSLVIIKAREVNT